MADLTPEFRGGSPGTQSHFQLEWKDCKPSARAPNVRGFLEGSFLLIVLKKLGIFNTFHSRHNFRKPEN